MPLRNDVGIAEVASIATLAQAFWRASRACRGGPEEAAMAADLDRALAALSADIRDGRAPSGRWTRFVIHDPKERVILAPSFRDRVVHHAMIAHMGPVLDGALVHDTFACRAGRGTLAAVLRAQHHVRRFPWFVKTDVRSYFASIDHCVLMRVLERRFKNRDLLALCGRVLAGAPGPAGLGLPIGALTSQYFANSYLDDIDRFLLEVLRVRAMVRYMDDILWWCDGREQARETLQAVRERARSARRLELKPNAQVGRSMNGVAFLGFRVLPGALLLSRRRRRRYAEARERWERAYSEGRVDGRGLQAGFDAALAITAHADAAGWRGTQLRRRPPVDG